MNGLPILSQDPCLWWWMEGGTLPTADTEPKPEGSENE